MRKILLCILAILLTFMLLMSVSPALLGDNQLVKITAISLIGVVGLGTVLLIERLRFSGFGYHYYIYGLSKRRATNLVTVNTFNGNRDWNHAPHWSMPLLFPI